MKVSKSKSTSSSSSTTTSMVSTTLLLPAVAVTLAFILVSVVLKGKGQSVNQKNIVRQPKVGGTTKLINEQGPWPDCLGILGTECKELIQSMIKKEDDITFQIIPQDSFITMDFRTNRVRIFVDTTNIVTKIPNRG